MKRFLGPRVLGGLTCLLLFVGPGCLGSAPREDILTTFYPVKFLTEAIVGNHLQVGVLIPPDAEPHEYDLKPSDVRRIEDAKLVIYHGAGLEAFHDQLITLTSAHHVATQEAAAGQVLRNGTDPGEIGPDPHVWLDPLLAKAEAHNILGALQRLDPGNNTSYTQNFETLASALERLDQDFAAGLAHCAKHKIITTHAAFGYMAAHYNFTQYAISGFEPDAEPSAQKVKETAELARRENITVIFFETLVSPRVAQVIASEAHARTEVLDPIEGIAAAHAKEGADYVSVMRENLAHLRDAMACT